MSGRPPYAEREARRARSGRKLTGADRHTNAGDGCSTGHPPLFAIAPAFELGDDNAYRLARNGRSRSLTAVAFQRFIGINGTRDPIRLDVELLEDLLVAKLPKEGTP